LAEGQNEVVPGSGLQPWKQGRQQLDAVLLSFEYPTAEV
jgi:hypothetical protein